MLQEEADFVPDYEEEASGQGVQAYLTMEPTLATTIGGGPTGPTLPERGRQCPLCPRRIAGKLRRHLQDAHLPWYLVPNLACWSCRCCESSLAFLHQRHGHHSGDWQFGDQHLGTWLSAVTGLLFTLSQAVGQKNPQELLRYVRRQQLYGPTPESVTTQTWSLWRHLERYLGDYPVDQFLCEPPNSIPGLLQ